MLRKSTKRRTGTIGKVTAAIALLAIGITAAQAHEVQTKFEMTVIQDAAFGSKIVSGRLADAIERIESRNVRPGLKFFAKNNLCVAYTMSGELEKAMTECNAAIELVQSRMKYLDDIDSVIYARYTAMALSNRGVLQAMRGATDLARSDFEEASKIPVPFSAPRKNLKHLEIRSAQVSVR